MQKRRRIRQLFAARLRRFHGDESEVGHVHVGNRSYSNFEDFAEQTSSRQSIAQTSSVSEFEQAEARTQELRQEATTHRESEAKPSRPEPPPAQARPQLRAAASESRPFSHPQDSFAAPTPAREPSSTEPFQVPRLFSAPPWAAESALLSSKPTSSHALRSSLLPTSPNREAPTKSFLPATQGRASLPSSSPLVRSSVPDFAATLPSPSFLPTGRPKFSSREGGSGGVGVKGEPLAKASVETRFPIPATLGAKSESLKQAPTQATLFFNADPKAALGAGLFAKLAVPGAKPFTQESPVRPLRPVSTWPNVWLPLRRADFSLFQALGKRAARFSDILFGRYARAARSEKILVDSKLLAELGILWRLWRKKIKRARAETKGRFSSESGQIEGLDESHFDDKPGQDKKEERKGLKSD